MKKALVIAVAVAVALTAGVSAYAANPFSDVTPDDWAYQAISDLSDQGVVEGYPDGTFKGERNMTRYELAQIIARLMAREDQLLTSLLIWASAYPIWKRKWAIFPGRAILVCAGRIPLF